MAEQKTNKTSGTDPSASEHKAEHTLFFGEKKALFGGFLSAAIALGGQWLVGQIYSGYEAQQLLEGMAQSAHYLASSIVTASATIIALMLTMISLSKQSDNQFDSIFFKRIERIGTLSAIALAAGILLLLFLSIPLQKSDQVPSSWFTVIYYFLTGFIAGLAGLVVSIVMMLLNAISSLIDVVRPTQEEDIEDAKEREKNESEAEKQAINKTG